MREQQRVCPICGEGTLIIPASGNWIGCDARRCGAIWVRIVTEVVKVGSAV